MLHTYIHNLDAHTLSHTHLHAHNFPDNNDSCAWGRIVWMPGAVHWYHFHETWLQRISCKHKTTLRGSAISAKEKSKHKSKKNVLQLASILHQNAINKSYRNVKTMLFIWIKLKCHTVEFTSLPRPNSPLIRPPLNSTDFYLDQHTLINASP